MAVAALITSESEGREGCMAARVYWCELPEAAGRLAIVRKPRAAPYLDEDIGVWRREGLDVVVSLLEAAEAAEVGLAGQSAAMMAAGLEFVSFPVVDRGVPETMASYAAIAEALASRITGGGSVGFHCHASLGRSPTLAAGVLVRIGLSPGEAIQRLRRARHATVPETDAQHAWIADYAAQLVAGGANRSDEK